MGIDPLLSIVFVIAVLLVGAAVAAEVAYAGLSRGRVRELSESGNGRATVIEALLRNPPQLLLTTMLMKTAGTVVAGIAMARLLPTDLAALRLILVTITIWLLFSAIQILSRVLVQPRTEMVGLRLARFMQVCTYLLWPVSAALRRIGSGVSEADAELVEESVFLTEDGLRLLINVREEEDSIQDAEREMIASILDMEETVAREVMVPRIDMVALSVETSLQEALDVIIQAGHSRIPVYEGNVDRILGFLYAKDLLGCFQNRQADMPIRDLLRPAHFVPISSKLNTLLREMQKRRVHIALVVDEYGGTAGLITIEDILEEIVGEIQDEYDDEEDSYVKPLTVDTYLLNARLDVYTLSTLLDVELPVENADTLGGLLYSLLGHVPEQGESVTCEGWLFTVMSLEGRRIDEVRVEPAPTAPPEQEDVEARRGRISGPDSLLNMPT